MKKENNMKLYDFMKLSMEDWDTYDTEYDACVTVCYIDEEDVEDSYDRFCVELMKKVEVIERNNDCLVCDWSKLIVDNIDKFRKFALDHWHKDSQYDGEDEEDDFIFAWINELHYLLAGYVSEDFYDVLLRLVENLRA